MLNLKKKVYHCLTKYQECRNSDKKLINAVYYEFHNSKLFKSDDNQWAIKLVDMYELPNPAHIIRWRQKFNENGQFMPTEESVIKARKLEEVKWREEMSPSNPSTY